MRHWEAFGRPKRRARRRRCVAALDNRALPLASWSHDRLFSPEARGWWVEPDLLPLSAAAAVE